MKRTAKAKAEEVEAEVEVEALERLGNAAWEAWEAWAEARVAVREEKAWAAWAAAWVGANMKRHLARVILSPGLMAKMFMTGIPGQYWRITEGVPPDAEFRGTGYDLGCNTVVLFYEHRSFPEVEEGGLIEKVLEISVESFYCAQTQETGERRQT